MLSTGALLLPLSSSLGCAQMSTKGTGGEEPLRAIRRAAQQWLSWERYYVVFNVKLPGEADESEGFEIRIHWDARAGMKVERYAGGKKVQVDFGTREDSGFYSPRAKMGMLFRGYYSAMGRLGLGGQALGARPSQSDLPLPVLADLVRRIEVERTSMTQAEIVLEGHLRGYSRLPWLLPNPDTQLSITFSRKELKPVLIRALDEAGNETVRIAITKFERLEQSPFAPDAFWDELLSLPNVEVVDLRSANQEQILEALAKIYTVWPRDGTEPPWMTGDPLAEGARTASLEEARAHVNFDFVVPDTLPHPVKIQIYPDIPSQVRLLYAEDDGTVFLFQYRWDPGMRKLRKLAFDEQVFRVGEQDIVVTPVHEVFRVGERDVLYFETIPPLMPEFGWDEEALEIAFSVSLRGVTKKEGLHYVERIIRFIEKQEAESAGDPSIE